MKVATDEEMARGYNLPPLHVRSLKAETRRNRAKHGKTRAVIGSQTDVDAGIFNKEILDKSPGCNKALTIFSD